MSETFLSIVIPVYKAESCLHELYSRLTASLNTITQDYEIVLVEDCGQDNSWSIILALAKQDQRLKGIQFSRNFGQHYGITAGLDYCDSRADWIVVMDCDLQDRPEEIPNLLHKALEGYDVVHARRVNRQDAFSKRFLSWLFYKFFNYITEMNYDGASGNFLIMSRKVLENFRQMREQLRFFGGLISWMGFRSASVDVQHDPRFAGESSYSIGKLWRLGCDTVIAYSDKPLRLVVRFGFTLSACTFLFALYIIYRRIAFGVPIVGWASLMVSLYFLSGIIISILGIVGIYLGKTFEQTKHRPLYIVNRTTENVTIARH